jgi:hypothetical protein
MAEDTRQTDERLVRDIVQTILKAKKTIRMYPENNPVYLKTVNDVYDRFREFLDYHDELTIRIKQYEILFDSTPVYSNPEKEDNLALFFFKDGLRELSFLKGLYKEEVEEFLKIIALDFDREAVDDDIVTLLWERDFQNIKYVADEEFLTEDEGYEEHATGIAKGRVASIDEIMKAYTDAFLAEGIDGISIVNLTDKDLQSLVKEMEGDQEGKIEKLSDILFEMLHHVENQTELEDIYRFIRNAMTYSLEQGNLHAFIRISRSLREISEDGTVPEQIKRLTNLLYSSINSEEFIKYVGEIFDAAADIEEELILEFKEMLDRTAIGPLVSVLGRSKTIQGRKRVISILVDLGRKDIQTLARGLYDSRWYVVRNILYILRQIGDKKAVEYLIDTVKHPDSRVRREAIKAIGELRNPLALQLLKDCLNDYDSSIRKTAVKALGNFGTETAKRIILGKMDEKDFIDRDFDEKKEFFEALSKWNDDDIRGFLVRILKKRVFFKRARHDENKACAAYCLGFVGNRDNLPILEKLRDSKNNLIREYANFAIRKIEYERR